MSYFSPAFQGGMHLKEACQSLEWLNIQNQRKFKETICIPRTPSGNTLRVSYHLCIRHTLGTVFDLHHILENTYRYFHIIKAKNMDMPSYAA